MKSIRPFRAHSVYACPCRGCQEEIEALPDGTIPDYCPSCAALRERDKE